MKIDTLPKDHNDKGYFIHVTPVEACTIIRSLSSQLEKKSSNTGRAEQRTEKGEYFSIGIDFTEEDEIKHLKERIAFLEHDNKRMDEFWGREFRKRSKEAVKKNPIKKKSMTKKKPVQSKRPPKRAKNGNR